MKNVCYNGALSNGGAFHAAVDIGASSGRVLVGALEGGRLTLREVYRFDNIQVHRDGHDCWDLELLRSEVLRGLSACVDAGMVPTTVAVDTWAVDYVLLDGADGQVGDAVSYRDTRTQGIYAVADALVDPAEAYRRTGIQRQTFNTALQLVALRREDPSQLERAERLLMIPDWLVWQLTGVKVLERTNASTTGLLGTDDRWDEGLMVSYGIPGRLFSQPAPAGTVVGPLSEDVAREVGFQAQVLLTASHDTASAFVSVPAPDDGAVFLSSGTWSLIGLEVSDPLVTPECYVRNFTNEGAYGGGFRFLRNVMGLWMVQSVRRELNGVEYTTGKGRRCVGGPRTLRDAGEGPYDFPMLAGLAREAEPFEARVDVDSPAFLSPTSMVDAVREACREAGEPVPETVGQLMRVIYLSLASAYAAAVDDLRRVTGRRLTSICITGGGCQDAYLNQIVADACALPVLAGPVEGTGIGNILVQLMAMGEVGSLAEARALVSRSFPVVRYVPRHRAALEEPSC